MHELSIALSILDLAAEEAERHAGIVTAIHVRLGPLSGVVRDALASAYDLARESSDFKETKLVIEEVPLKAFCRNCAGEQTLPSVQNLCCPRCGGPVMEIVQGNELEVSALEIET